MDICIIGAGHVGLVTGACFAELGNKVICVDNDEEKIKTLKRGRMPIYEPGLEEMVRQNAKKKRLSFTTSIKEGVTKSEVIFISVGTPPRERGEVDLSAVENVSKEIAASMTSFKLIVEKSTVPVETGERVKSTMSLCNKKKVTFEVASNPEFLREGSAIEDFMRPDRIVIGVESKKARDILVKLYTPIKAPMVITDIKSAEIIKHASNSFLAMKISFINALSVLCDKTGADIVRVAEGMGMDKRIGKAFLNAGIGFGGFCFPKDLSAFIHISERHGYDFGLLKEVAKVNEIQKGHVVEKMEDLLWNLQGKVVAVLGLSFKPDTDDIRFSPSIDIVRLLQAHGVKVKAYDPHAMHEAKKVLTKVEFCKDAYEAAQGSDCLFLATEWEEFARLDFVKIKKLMRQPIVLDGRNAYSPKKMKDMGFTYVGIGRR